jgi:uncharacterized protein YkwD
MFSWFQKHFIPHENNNYRPHILRDYSIRNVIIILIFLEMFTFLIPFVSNIYTVGNMAAVLPGILSDITNNNRQQQNLPSLTVSPLLTAAAQLKANDMATNSYFAHTSPAGKTPWYWLDQVGYNYQYAGENLAVNFSDSQDVVNAWMASPTHRANIVKGNYTEIGTAVASGMYQGQETTFVVQDYANPMPMPTTAEKVPIIKTTTETAPKINSTAILKESTNVLGAETVATQNENTPTIQNTVASTIQATFWQKLLASPRHITNIFLYAVLGIILFALLLYIFIKRKNHHYDLITNGLVVIAIVGAIFLMNYYLTHHDMSVSDSLNYSTSTTAY